MKPSGSRPKRLRAYRKSGFHGMQAALSRGGLSALDGRSAIARAVRDWRATMASDLGGEAELAQAERTMLDVAAEDLVLLTVANAWLRENASGIINRRRRSFVPLVEQRLRVASHLAELLKTLAACSGRVPRASGSPPRTSGPAQSAFRWTVRVALDVTFAAPGPPAHPNCRCTSAPVP